MVCYFIVSPKLQPGSYIVENGRPGYWIKFGDGTLRDAYDTHNPSCLGRQNDQQQRDTKYQVFNLRGIDNPTEVGLGKALEWNYIKWLCDREAETREWHFVSPHPGTSIRSIDQLIAVLQRAMNLFPVVLAARDPTSGALRLSNTDAATSEFQDIMINVASTLAPDAQIRQQRTLMNNAHIPMPDIDAAVQAFVNRPYSGP